MTASAGPAPDPTGNGSAGPRTSGLRPFDPRLLRRAAAARTALVVDVSAGVAGTLLLLAQVTLLATVIARVFEPDPELPAATVAALVAVIAIRALLARVVEVSGRRAAVQVMSTLRLELVARRLRRGGADLDHVDSGELATAAVQGVDGLEAYFARYLPQVVLAILVPTAVILWTLVVDVQSAVIMLVTLPLIPVFMILIGRSTESRTRARWEAMVTLSSHFLDVVRGLPTLRAFNRGRAQIPRIADTTDRYRRTTMSTLRLSFLSGLVLDLATTVSIALVAVTLGVRLVGGSLPLRPALTVLLLVPELYAPIRQVGALFHASTDGLVAAERILELVDAPDPSPTVVSGSDDEADGVDVPPDPSAVPVRLDDLTVTFPGRSAPALDGVDLEIEPGRTLVVTGPSGAGKTTLGRAVLGLIRPTSGRITVGGVDLATVDPDRWRTRLGWAPQHPVLVHGTVADNIALGCPDASRTAIEEAARAASVDDFVSRLPAGYDTVVGSGGRGLSAGQRQRIGLARALLRPAGLLVLDEPTVHLDRETAAAVGESITARRGSCTLVIVTHDPQLIGLGDRVIELRHGTVPDLSVVDPRGVNGDA